MGSNATSHQCLVRYRYGSRSITDPSASCGEGPTRHSPLSVYPRIWLSGPTPPCTALIGGLRALPPGGRPFHRIRQPRQRVADPRLPGDPRRIILIGWRPCRFCAVARGITPAPCGAPVPCGERCFLGELKAPRSGVAGRALEPSICVGSLRIYGFAYRALRMSTTNGVRIAIASIT